MQDLTEVTQEVHYENYRSDRLAKGGNAAAPAVINSEVNGGSTGIANGAAGGKTPASKKGPEKERMIVELQEKEAQIKKMQEMMAKMQAQLQDKK